MGIIRQVLKFNVLLAFDHFYGVNYRVQTLQNNFCKHAIIESRNEVLKCDVFVHFVTSRKVVLFLWAHEIFLNYHFHTIQCYLLKRARSSSNCCCDGALYVLQNDSDKKIDHKPLF